MRFAIHLCFVHTRAQRRDKTRAEVITRSRAVLALAKGTGRKHGHPRIAREQCRLMATLSRRQRSIERRARTIGAITGVLLDKI